jgi:predicted hydrocarbon binding protein
MEFIPDSGFFNSNKFARIFLESIREICGENGLRTILNYAYLPSLAGQLPPDNLDRAFDFAHFSMINQALEEIYGDRGGRGLALRVGRTTFDDVLKDYGELAGVGDLAFRTLPLARKIKAGLEAMADIFTEKSDQISSVLEFEDHFLYRVERCPVCWGRTSAGQPICYYLLGLLREGLCWVSGGKEFNVRETSCIALGHQACEFIIPKKAEG